MREEMSLGSVERNRIKSARNHIIVDVPQARWADVSEKIWERSAAMKPAIIRISDDNKRSERRQRVYTKSVGLRLGDSGRGIAAGENEGTERGLIGLKSGGTEGGGGAGRRAERFGGAFCGSSTAKSTGSDSGSRSAAC